MSPDKVRGLCKFGYYGYKNEFEWEIYIENSEIKFRGKFNNNIGEELNRSWSGEKFR